MLILFILEKLREYSEIKLAKLVVLRVLSKGLCNMQNKLHPILSFTEVFNKLQADENASNFTVLICGSHVEVEYYNCKIRLHSNRNSLYHNSNVTENTEKVLKYIESVYDALDPTVPVIQVISMKRQY